MALGFPVEKNSLMEITGRTHGLHLATDWQDTGAGSVHSLYVSLQGMVEGETNPTMVFHELTGLYDQDHPPPFPPALSGEGGR